MTLGDLITRLQDHFSPEERSLPGTDTYPGRNESVLGAINAAVQFLTGNAAWTRRGQKGFLLRAPIASTCTVTEGSDEVTFSGDYIDGCAISITGASQENRIHGTDPDTGTITLVNPHDGPSGTVACTIYHDCITLPEEIGEILQPVCIKGATFLACVPSVTQLSGPTERYEDYGMEDRVTLYPPIPDVGSTTGTPVRYCVDTHQQTVWSAPQQRLRIYPAPAESCLLEARVRYAAPVYNIDSDLSLELPIPHGYADSILVPVAEKHLTRSPFFRNESARSAIDEAYASAIALLRTINPQAASGRRMRSLY